MQIENLKVGRGLEVYVTRAGYRYRLVSTVEGTSPNRVYITLIASGEKVFRFLDGDQIDLVYRDGTTIIQWEKVRGSVETLEGTTVHSFYSTRESESFNRRNAYRVEIDEEVVFSHFHHVEKVEKAEKTEVEEIDEYGHETGTVTVETFEGSLKDLSESGCGIYTNRILHTGDEIGFFLFTPFGTMYFKAEVVRHMERRSGKFMEFYGCRFMRANRNLGRHLFAVQRERIRKQRGD